MRGQLQEGNIHVVDLCEFASFGSFYRAYFMCNLAEILILSSHCMCNPFVFDLMRIRQPGMEQYISKDNNFGYKYSYLHGKSGIIRVLTSEYKMMTGCLILVAWSHTSYQGTMIYQQGLYQLEKVLSTPNSVYLSDCQFLAKIIAFFGDVLLNSRLMDFHQVKDKRVAPIPTATYLNFSQVAHEISSVEAFKRSKLKEDLCIDIFFLQLLSHVQAFIEERVLICALSESCEHQ